MDTDVKLAATGHGNESLWIGSLGATKRQSHDFATFPPNSSSSQPPRRFSSVEGVVFSVVGYSPSSDFPSEPVVAYLHWLGYVCSFLTFCFCCSIAQLYLTLLLFRRSV